MPPLTGIRCPVGLQLPLPRRSLGVEFVHRGKTDQYFVLIPRTMDAPCSARQVFTTVHDNQAEACVLVLYGDDPVASNNALLGQVRAWACLCAHVHALAAIEDAACASHIDLTQRDGRAILRRHSALHLNTSVCCGWVTTIKRPVCTHR